MLQFVGSYSLEIGERVECYYNSKKQLVSIRSIDSKNENQSKIVAYAEYLHLQDASFSYCASNNRKSIKGIFAGIIPIMPNNEMMILHDGIDFITINNEEVVGANYAVCYLNMILAEKTIKKGDEKNEPIHKEWIF